MSTATISHAIFGGWRGVTDADVPAIGWQVMADRDDLRYLADYNAKRPPTEADLAKYAAQKADLAWARDNGDPYGVLPPQPVPSPAVVTPVPETSEQSFSCAAIAASTSQPVTASGEIVPATGPIPDATRERLAAEAAAQKAADEARERAHERFDQIHDEHEAEQTKAIPAAGQITEAIEAVTEEKS